MEIQAIPIGNLVLVDLRGELLAEDYMSLRRIIYELLEQNKTKIAINFEMVPRYSPDGFDELSNIRLDIESRSGALRIFNPNVDLEISLRTLGLEGMIVHRSLRKELAAAKAKADLEKEQDLPPSEESEESPIEESQLLTTPVPSEMESSPQTVPLPLPSPPPPPSVQSFVNQPPTSPPPPLPTLARKIVNSPPPPNEVESMEAPPMVEEVEEPVRTIPEIQTPSAGPPPPPRKLPVSPPAPAPAHISSSDDALIEEAETSAPAVPPSQKTYHIVIIDVDQKGLDRFYGLMDRYGQDQMIKGRDSKSLFDGDKSVMFIDYYLENNVKTIQLKIAQDILLDIRTLWGFKKHHIIWDLVARDMNGFILVLPPALTDSKLRAMQDLFKFFFNVHDVKLPYIICVPDTLNTQSADKILTALAIDPTVQVFQFSENDPARTGEILNIFTNLISTMESGQVDGE